MGKIQFDYQSIKNRVIQDLSSKEEWASFLNYGVLDNVISSIVNELYYEVQYGEYNSLENYWNLARNRSSLLQMSPMHGYVVPRKRTSRGTVRISTSEEYDAPHGADITIPKYFQFSGNNIYVCSNNDVIFSGEEDYIDVPCVQGEVKSVTFVAEGEQFEEKTILDDSIDNSNFELTVDGVKWEITDSLFLCSNDTNAYQMRTLPNLSGIIIRFGNDIFGKKLTKNSVITFTYVATKGSEGNIYTEGVIDKVESQAFDTNGDSVKLYCKNVSYFVGGLDYPSLEEIRDVSPKVYQTGNRATSRDDYETILRQINFLSKINVWGAYETNLDNHEDPWHFIPSEENVVHVALLDTAYNELNDAQKTEVIDTLYKVSDPTDIITFEKPLTIPVIFHVDGKLISTSYTTQEVKNYIKSALSEVYGIQNVDFGNNIYYSDYIRLIDEVKGIDNHISWVELYEEGKYLNSAYTGDFELPIHPIDWASVKIQVKDTSNPENEYVDFATCNEQGNIIGVSDDTNTFITTTSFLDLNTGVGKINVVSGLTGHYTDYIFKIYYQFIEKDLMNTKRSNILYYENADIKLHYNDNQVQSA